MVEKTVKTFSWILAKSKAIIMIKPKGQKTTTMQYININNNNNSHHFESRSWLKKTTKTFSWGQAKLKVVMASKKIEPHENWKIK